MIPAATGKRPHACAALALLLSACGPIAGGGDTATPGKVVVDVVVPSGPPADRTETKPASPGPGHIWVAGHWDNIDGNYVWKEGRWLQARPDYEYVRARYDFDSSKQLWIYHRPHWKRRHAQVIPAPAPAVVTPPAPTPAENPPPATTPAATPG
jgi:hypothetical protein